ncbi:Succinate dehydrogenase assembly factor 4 [Dillenia turbinata]|uniref:Succinate dehydrogenase assembly factor 4, mitochondrial n=1 Tax=Dillenia turbinata TaxID=194707 RepID=A0AAN8VAV1_9MAGN
MASNLGRLITTLAEQSKPKLGFLSPRSETGTLFKSNAAIRLISSSTPLSNQQKNPKKEREVAEEEISSEPKMSLENDFKDDEDEGDDEDGDDDGESVHVNKETGEVGGPKGPEPTRYGDWERAGRCYDF